MSDSSEIGAPAQKEFSWDYWGRWDETNRALMAGRRGPSAPAEHRDMREARAAADRAGRQAGKSGCGVLGAQLVFEQVHGLQEGLLLGGRELVEYAGQRPGGTVQPFPDQGGLGRDDLDDRAPPVGRVGVALDEARAVEVGEHAADGGQGQAEPGD